MLHEIDLTWRDPLTMAEITSGQDFWQLCYSAKQRKYTGADSYLFIDGQKHYKNLGFDELDNLISKTEYNKFGNIWAGYFSYEMLHDVEFIANFNQDAIHKSFINLPKSHIVNFKTTIKFDHINKKIRAYSADYNLLQNLAEKWGKKSEILKNNIKIDVLSSNMSDDEYLQKAENLIDKINNGELLQANLTRKFFTNIKNNYNKKDVWGLFRELCKNSPSAYSCLAYLGEKDYVISSSPEQFLKIEGRKITSRPIKGTISSNFNVNNLLGSYKNKAENLMITDLIRNDISKSCKPGTVKTPELFSIETHNNLHHMHSTIEGELKPEISTINAIKSCFPPGSMTGAPKIKAIEICSNLEQYKRGIYSGIIGWIGGELSAEFSVVIRTIIISGDKLEFQVGGGITTKSTPIDELEETLIKSKAIVKTLSNI